MGGYIPLLDTSRVPWVAYTPLLYPSRVPWWAYTTVIPLSGTMEGYPVAHSPPSFFGRMWAVLRRVSLFLRVKTGITLRREVLLPWVIPYETRIFRQFLNFLSLPHFLLRMVCFSLFLKNVLHARCFPYGWERCCPSWGPVFSRFDEKCVIFSCRNVENVPINQYGGGIPVSNSVIPVRGVKTAVLSHLWENGRKEACFFGSFEQ